MVLAQLISQYFQCFFHVNFSSFFCVFIVYLFSVLCVFFLCADWVARLALAALELLMQLLRKIYVRPRLNAPMDPPCSFVYIDVFGEWWRPVSQTYKSMKIIKH
jgi:hypothetical protein